MVNKICAKCKLNKSAKEYYLHKRYGLQNICKICSKEYRIQNRERILKKRRERYRRNEEKFKQERIKRRAYNRKYKKQRYKTDPLYKLSVSCRTRIKCALKGIGVKNKLTTELIGCSWEDFKQHIEKQFKNGMTWENYGFDSWHIDHIIPLASAKNKTELLKLFHYTNCQPLWAKDNLEKGDKLILSIPNIHNPSLLQ